MIICLLTLSLALNFDISAAKEGPGETDMDTYLRACNFHCRFHESEKATEIYKQVKKTIYRKSGYIDRDTDNGNNRRLLCN